jgi:hypothetical protein
VTPGKEQRFMIPDVRRDQTRPPRNTGTDSSAETYSGICRTSYTDFFERINERIDARELAAAQRLLRFVHKLYPDNEFIREQIIFTAEALGDWEMVNDTLLTLLEEADETEEIGDLVFHSVRLMVTKLDRARDAITLIGNHLNAYIRQPGCIDWTQKHLAEGPYREQLIHIVESAMSTPLQPEDRMYLCNALGSWYATRAGDRERASEWYRSSLRIQPGNPEAIDGLISIHGSHR